jgi:hypothetical protein
MRALLRLLARRCPVHDVAAPPLVVAEMEAALGIDARAVARVWAECAPGIPDHYDPALLDCGRGWCQRRRWSR